MATAMHTDGSHHHGNPNSTLYSNSFTRTFRGSNRMKKKEKKKMWIYRNHRQREKASNNLLVRCDSVLVFVFTVLLTGPGP